MAASKDQLNKLIQQLSNDALPIAAEFLEVLVSHPRYRIIPLDDEPTTEDDLKQIQEAKEAFARGEGIDLKDVIDELLN